MRIKKIFKEETGFVELIFLIPGHSHNIIDQRHSIIQSHWKNSELFCPEDWMKMINTIPGFRAELLEPFDFSGWLKPCINQNIDKLMNNAHIFRFTANGLITKQFVTDLHFSEWRGRSTLNGSSFEPFQVVLEAPQGVPLPLAPKKIGMIFSSFIHCFTNLFPVFDAKIADLVPTEALNSINLLASHHNAQFKDFSSNSAPTAPAVEVVAQHEQEFIVAAILQRKWAKNKKNMLWKVRWEGFDDREASWEPEESFIDEDGKVNDIWKNFEDTHPRRKEPARKKRKINKET